MTLQFLTVCVDREQSGRLYSKTYSLSALLSVQGLHMDSLKAHILSCILVLPACTSRRHSGWPFWERKPLYLVRNWAAAPCCFWDFTVLQNGEKRLQNSRIWLLVPSQKKLLHFGISLNAMPALSSFFCMETKACTWYNTKDSRAVRSRGESLPHCPLPSHCWRSIYSECWSGYLHYLE